MIDARWADRVCVIDTETTGLPKSEWARVIEIGAVMVDGQGREIGHFGCMVKPDILDDRAEKALEINHITREELETAPPMASVYQSFRHWWDGHGRPEVTAFNVAFDRLMLERMGIRPPNWGPCVMLEAQPIMGEAGALKQWGNGSYKWPRLVEAVEFFGLEQFGPAHRALADARTAAAVLQAIREITP